LPIEIQLSAVPVAAESQLAAQLNAARHAAAVEASQGTDLAVPAPQAPPMEPADEDLGRYLSAPVADVLSAYEVTARPGEVAQAAAAPGTGIRRVFLIGLGDAAPADMRKAGAALGRRATAGRRVVTTAVLGQPADRVQAFAEGVMLGAYRFTLASSANSGGQPTGVQLLVAEDDGAARAVERAVIMARAVALARDLTNMPSALKSPKWLADEAAAIGAVSGLFVRVAEPAELAAEGFGGLLGVGSGSVRPPRLIELSYEPPGWDRHVVLAGKGITFDSGGLSLKPSDNMKLMKTDMAGGAAVIATMSALGRLGARARVTGLVAAAENMPSGSALRPGDVITHYGGITTEVLNTDAEGRLVLADALAYAVARLKPDVILDIATLTGSARVALGTTLGALYATDDGLASELAAASAAAGEPLWRMPLVEDYRDALDSPVADLANIPHTTGRPRAGSIDAALFLREFAGGLPWAHLDIAGPARSTADEGEQSKGATGFGTRALLHWLTAA
jgi:leucyl aminopeptidase